MRIGKRPTEWTVNPTKRTFLHNPLHDYESVWWTAVWFVFHCKPNGVAGGVMEEARNDVFSNRSLTFLATGSEQAWELLPEVLQPLGKVLAEMKGILRDAYLSFEKSFDGSEMLLVFPKLRECLRRLVDGAQGLDVTPPVQPRKLGAGTGQHGAVTFEEQGKQGQRTMKQEGGAGGEPMAVDTLTAGAGTGESVSGKRVQSGSPPQVNRTSKKKKLVGP